MGQEHFFGANGQTSIHPLIAIVLVIAGVLILALPRRKAVIPFLAAGILVPVGTNLVIVGMNFTALRILIAFGLARVLIDRAPREEYGLRPIHKAVIWWVVFSVITFTLLWADAGALINRLGLAYAVLGGYFTLVGLIRDEADIERVVRVLGYVCFILGLCMMAEQITGRNVFSFVGSVPFVSTVREGKIRAQGPFIHPLCAGTLGAMLVPVFIGAYQKYTHRMVAVLGIVGGLLMTYASMSSTPLLTIVVGLAGLFCWPLRNQMKWVRRATVLALISLHIVMKGPVWSLIAKVDIMGGSGYQRYELVNQTINHFSDWWLLGVKSTFDWGWDMWDTIDWYVTQCTSGGLITLAFFVAIMVYGFKDVGRGVHAPGVTYRSRRFLWALGATLFANAVGFIGVGYLDQSVVAWYALLVIIATEAANVSRLSELQNSTPSVEVEAETAELIYDAGSLHSQALLTGHGGASSFLQDADSVLEQRRPVAPSAKRPHEIEAPDQRQHFELYRPGAL